MPCQPLRSWIRRWTPAIKAMRIWLWQRLKRLVSCRSTSKHRFWSGWWITWWCTICFGLMATPLFRHASHVCICRMPHDYWSQSPHWAALWMPYWWLVNMRKNAVNSAGVWDDEDFMPTMFNVDFQASSVFSSDPSKVNEKIRQSEKSYRMSQLLAGLSLWASTCQPWWRWRSPSPQPCQAQRGSLPNVHSCLRRSRKRPSHPVKKWRNALPLLWTGKLLVPGPPRQVRAHRGSKGGLQHVGKAH